MAHLAHCWCGKIYRCDLEHPKRGNVLTAIEEMHVNNCPDKLLHGPLQIGPFLTITSEKFTTLSIAGPPAERLADIIERNSIKESIHGKD